VKVAPLAALVLLIAHEPGAINPPFQNTSYRDGYGRPRALAIDASAGDGLLYVALSTADAVAVVDPAPGAPRVLARVAACAFPDAVAALPDGGALVACRFDRDLRRLQRDGKRRWRVERVPAGDESGWRGLAIAPGGELAYAASPAAGGVKVVSLAGGGVVQTIATGLSPRALRVVPAGALPAIDSPLLLVSNFIDHTVTVHAIGADRRLAPALQMIRTDAPVLDMLVAPAPAGASLLLFTHEDRPLSRAHGSVEGLDSGVVRLVASPRPGGPPFEDPGPGKRAFVNLGERTAPVIEPGAAAIAADGTIAVAGGGTDNLLVAAEGELSRAPAVTVGADPSAVAALPGGGFVTADRLSDTLTFVFFDAVRSTLAVGPPERRTAAARGELLFYSRALVPNNVADGPLSLYTCAACHDDGDIDGRRHPAKRNRFFSMTKTCRGLGTTAPYLSLGEPATIEAFADNIVATHAQGAERDPAHFDKFPVTLRVRAAQGWEEVVLSPAEVRAALAAYMAAIPPEPSPFLDPSARALTAEARRGLAVFRDGCAGCHQLVGNSALGNLVPPPALERRLRAGQVALTSPRRYAVGTPVLGDGGNNPPSLRGVWAAAPYFSDGSARTLEEVLRRTDPDAPGVHSADNAARPSAFKPEEQAALLAFLRAL
jgi:mono/diheme cytochrome c family protein